MVLVDASKSVRDTVLAVGAEGGVVTVRLGHRWPSRPRSRCVAAATSTSPGSTLWLLPVSSAPRARGLALLLRRHHLASRPRSAPRIPCLALHRCRRHYFCLHTCVALVALARRACTWVTYQLAQVPPSRGRAEPYLSPLFPAT